MVEAVRALTEGHSAAGKALIDGLEKAETEADILKREITMELSKSVLEAAAREDLLNLVKGADRIADDAHDCGRIISTLDTGKLTAGSKQLLVNMSSAVSQCASNLKESVSVLMKSPMESLVYADRVDESEALVDSFYYQGLLELSKLTPTEMNGGQIALFFSLLSTLEDTADSCQDMADLLRVVVIRRT